MNTIGQMTIKYFTPQSIEWLEARKKYVTATEVGALLGLDPYKSANKVYKGKLEEVQVIDNIYMRAGRFLEPAIIADLPNYGIPAEPAHKDKLVMVINEEIRLSATLDGKALWEGKKYIVECKTTSGMTKDKESSKFSTWYTQIPLYYYTQIQTQMMLSKLDQSLLVCVEAAIPFPIVGWEILADKKLHSHIETEVTRFWNFFDKGGKSFTVNKSITKYIGDTWENFATIILK